MTFVNSAIGGAWKRETHNLSSLSTTAIKTFLMADFHLLEIILVIFNDAMGKTKGLSMKIINKDNTIKDTTFGRIGYGINVNINATKVGANMVLAVQNNENYDLSLKLAFIKL